MKEGQVEILQLRYFRTMAQMESVTNAALHHNVPQPSMSQSLARLENELGVRLFDRRNNRIILNEAGSRFLDRINEALNIIDNATESISAKSNDISGPIRLLLMENQRFVSLCVSRFATKYQDVDFSISQDIYSDNDQRYDMCISSSLAYKDMKESVPLVKEEIVLAVNENHPLAGKEHARLTEFRKDKFITMSSHTALNRITYEKCREAGFEPHVSFICDDPYYIRKYVSENMGVALAPSISWEGRFRANTKLIRIDEPSIMTTSYLVWNNMKYHSPAVTAFRDFLISESRNIKGNLI